MIEYEAKMEPRKVRRRHLNPKIKKALTPSVETQEHVEWAVAGVWSSVRSSPWRSWLPLRRY